MVTGVFLVSSGAEKGNIFYNFQIMSPQATVWLELQLEGPTDVYSVQADKIQ